MYTQCPACSTSFRVTAEVLKQAGGKVRCGGCGHAFNALLHLSEEKPAKETPSEKPEGSLPELTPEPLDTDSPPAAAPRETMSPEQSAALLKTLDELAGDDVRLEDTGIEWRVLDDDEPGRDDAPSATLLDEDLSADLESRKVDEILTSTATPLDEVLDAGANTAIDSPEVFAATATKTVPDNELRFDDNTGLPEDDDYEEPEAVTPVVPEPVRDAPEPMANIQVDLGFGDPDEWQDLLEEVTPGEESAATGSTDIPELPADTEPTIEDELDALNIELDEADEDALAEDGDELSSRMEALSLELSGIQEELDILAADSGERSIIEELDALEIVEDEIVEDEIVEAERNAEVSLDEASEADALEALSEDLDAEQDEPADAIAEDTDEADKADEDADGELSLVEEEADDAEPLVLEAEDETRSQDDDTDEDRADEGDADQEDPREEDEAEATSIDDDLLAAAFEVEARESSDAPTEHVVPPMTEEEQTINMLIDQDLMALAVEDEDGFTSTMVLAEIPDGEDDGNVDDDGEARPVPDIPELPVDAPVEAIVMEGAIARSAVDLEEKEAEEAALKEEAAALIAAATAEEQAAKKPLNRGLIAGIVVLVLLLIIQVVHFSRDALARSPAVNDVLAPIYESVGAPLTPAWDVTGWDFEATRGSTDETGEVLSIFSRIGNNSESALPYPVISVSLTDRFEETIGSRVFDPDEYLADDLDPRQTVAPGTTFNALMLIESPADAATGFKLNVCYRLADRDLKCAIKDFR